MRHLSNTIMNKSGIFSAAALVASLLLTGCASTEVTSRNRLVYDKLPKPDHIFVYDFASSPADVPADSSLAGQTSEGTTTEEEAAAGRELGTAIAAQLVSEIKEMGLPAEQVSGTAKPQVNDIVLRGYLVSIEKGSAAARMTIGFGAGGSELTTAIEGYQMTTNGLRKVGSAIMGSEGSKGPGAAVGGAAWLITGSPVGLIVGGGLKVYGEASGRSGIKGRAKATAKEIAEQLKKRFKEEGWIE
jgi:hypothetical protein